MNNYTRFGIKRSKVQDRMDPSYLKAMVNYKEPGINAAFPMVRLGEVIELARVGQHVMPSGHGSVRLIRAREIKRFFINYTVAPFIEEKANETLASTRLEENDIVLAIQGAIGKVAIVPKIPEEANINQSLARLVCNKDLIDPTYLLFYFMSNEGQKQLQSIRTGITVPRIRLSSVIDLVIPLPPMEIQQKFQQVYSSLQKKQLALMATELTDVSDMSVKKSQYTSFSIHFKNLEDRLDPVYYRPKTSSFAGLMGTEYIAVESLSELATMSPEKISMAEIGIESKKYLCLDANSIDKHGEIDVHECKVLAGKDLGNHFTKRVDAGDIVFSMLNPRLSRFAMIGAPIQQHIEENQLDGIVASRDFAIIKAMKDVNPRFLAWFFRTKAFTEQMADFEKGSTIHRINARDLELIRVPFFSKDDEARLIKAQDEMLKLRSEIDAMLRDLFEHFFEFFDDPSSLIKYESGDS